MSVFECLGSEGKLAIHGLALLTHERAGSEKGSGPTRSPGAGRLWSRCWNTFSDGNSLLPELGPCSLKRLPLLERSSC